MVKDGRLLLPVLLLTVWCTNAGLVEAHKGKLVHNATKSRLEYAKNYCNKCRKSEIASNFIMYSVCLEACNGPERYVSAQMYRRIVESIKKSEKDAGMESMGDITLPIENVSPTLLFDNVLDSFFKELLPDDKNDSNKVL